MGPQPLHRVPSRVEVPSEPMCNRSHFFLIGSLLVTKFDFLLFSGIFSSFSLVFSLAATHPKYTPGSLPILAHTQRDVCAAAKPEADSQTLKSLATPLRKHREINGPILGQSCEMTCWNWLTCMVCPHSSESVECGQPTLKRSEGR